MTKWLASGNKGEFPKIVSQIFAKVRLICKDVAARTLFIWKKEVVTLMSQPLWIIILQLFLFLSQQKLVLKRFLIEKQKRSFCLFQSQIMGFR